MNFFGEERWHKITEKDVNYIVAGLEKLEGVVKDGLELLSGKITDMKIDLGVVKQTVIDTKKEVFGNGKEGLTTRQTKAEGRLTAIEGAQDQAKTNEVILDAKLVAMKNQIIRWTGIGIGINLCVAVIATIILNWKYINAFFGGH